MAYDMEILVLAWKRHRHVDIKVHPYYEDKQGTDMWILKSTLIMRINKAQTCGY
jgi:hypothetical protein